MDFSAVTPPSLGTCSFKELPRAVFSYILKTSWRHRLPLCLLTAVVFLMDVVPLELQRRVVNDLVKHRAFGLVVILGIVYSGVVVVQGGIKLTLNVYRGWVGERAKRELRRRIHAVTDVSAGSPAAEAEGIAVAMVVAEVEALGGFVGESIPGRCFKSAASPPFSPTYPISTRGGRSQHSRYVSRNSCSCR